MKWYYGINEEQVGPVEFAELQALVQQGKLGPRDLVWNQSLGDQWVEAQTISGLGFVGTPPPVPIVMQGAVEPRVISAIPLDSTSEGFLKNAELTRRARESLKGQWGLGIGIALVFVLVSNLAPAMIPGIGGLVSLLIAGPMSMGFALAFLTLIRGGQAEVGQLFEGFRAFGNALGAYILMSIFIFGWTLLLIIPGIIASISYSMTFFVLADDPELGPMDAIRRSKEMMRGYKWQYFCLCLRFIGWSILCILTFFIGYLWLMPYMQTSFAHFYEMVRKNYRRHPSVA
ncbi:DUF975 family protein [Kiritimatiellota bacterium B12222]|nr:DUF975 family protein [Kiritimatiellota bacterium B12222]